MPEPKTGVAPANDPTNKAANPEELLMQIFSMLQQAMGQQAPAAPEPQPQAPMAAQPPMAPPQGQPQGPGPVEQPGWQSMVLHQKKPAWPVTVVRASGITSGGHNNKPDS